MQLFRPGVAPPLPPARLLEEESNALDGGGARITEAGARAGVVQIEDRVEAERGALLDVRDHPARQRGAAALREGPVVEVAGPVLVSEAEAGDHGHARVEGDRIDGPGLRHD